MQIWCHDGDFALSHLSTEPWHLREPPRTPDDAYVPLALIAALFGEIQPKPPHGNGARYYAWRCISVWLYGSMIRESENTIVHSYCSIRIMYFKKIFSYIRENISVFKVMNILNIPASNHSYVNVSTVSLLINGYYPLHYIHVTLI